MVASLGRRTAFLARYGGEEFAVVLPETPIESAVLFAERIRAEVEAATFDYDGAPSKSPSASALPPWNPPARKHCKTT
jgi:diguanylate cyclase (GGDEF)-like protein